MRKGNLLITTVGKRSLTVCREWLGRRRNYDTFFIFYDNHGSEEFKHLPDYFKVQAGYKYPSIHKILNDNKDLLSDYEFFFMPDDDVRISTTNINKLFAFASKKNMLICQPSLFPKNLTWRITANNSDTKYRYVRMIEIMCPLFSKKALRSCLPSFIENQSGFGLEAAWVKLLTPSTSQFAIYDQVVATHENPHDINNGSLYTSLKRQGIVPYEDLNRMENKYGVQLDFSEIKLVYKTSASLKRTIRRFFKLPHATTKIIAIITVSINAPLSKVWQALINPILIKYLLGVEVVSDWKKGSNISFRDIQRGKAYESKGTIVNIEPEKFLHSTYYSPLPGLIDRPENYANIIYRFFKENDRTILTVSQDNIPNEEERQHIIKNWSIVLDNFKILLENNSF